MGNLRDVWKEFYGARRRTLPGVDGVTAEEFRRREETNLRHLRSEMLRRYQFSPLLARAFKKPNSEKFRIICIPTIADRIVQRAISKFLIDDTRDRLGLKNGVSFAFLKGEGGVRKALEIAKRKRRSKPWAYKSDITSFFDTIKRTELLSKVRRKLKAPSLLPLVGAMVNCEARAEDGFTQRKMVEANIVAGVGLRQGMPISPLLANLVLDRFDAVLTNSGFELVRYADDFIVFADSEAECHKIDQLARALLAEIDHTIPPIGDGKTQIKRPDEAVEFLGLLLSPSSAGSYELRISDDQVAEILNRLEKMADLPYLETERINIANLMKKVRDIQRGYLNAYDNAEPRNFQSFKDRLNAAADGLPENILRKILPLEALNALSPSARRFLCLDQPGRDDLIR